MLILLGTVFVASLLGSLHCVGMCGPFALLASVDPERRAAALVPTAAYSFGRLITYTIVGAIFGTLGLALNQGGSIANWQQSATYVAGVLMVLVGLISLARYLKFKIPLPAVFSPIQKSLQHWFARTTSLPPIPRALAIGALTSLMPCGWLYTFAIAAAGTGSPVHGMLLMAAFWLGTVPIMTALVLGVSRIGTRLQQRIPVIMAVLVVMIGVFTIAYRAPVVIGADTNVTVGLDNVADNIREVDHSQLPCCQGK